MKEMTVAASHLYALYALGSSALWGLSNVLDKLGLHGCDSPMVAFVVIGLVYGAIALVALAAGNIGAVGEFARRQPRSVGTLVVSAALSSVGTYVFLMALDCTHRTHLASAIAYTAPIFTLIAVKVLDRSTPVHPMHLLAIALTVGGVAAALYTD